VRCFGYSAGCVVEGGVLVYGGLCLLCFRLEIVEDGGSILRSHVFTTEFGNLAAGWYRERGVGSVNVHVMIHIEIHVVILQRL
jgi:hypothetical protein